MDRNTLQERRKHFLAFVTALVIVFTMLPMWTDAYGDDGSWSESDEPACEHKNTILRPYDGREATCVEGCLGEIFCNDCEQSIVDEVEIPIDPNNHVGSKVPAGNAKDATCVAEGYTGDILCDACNKVWEKGSKIPINLNNHVGSEKSAGNAKEATCVEEGYTGDILCDKCNNVWEKGEEIPIDKTKHAGPIVDAGNANEASCTEEGYTGDKKCQACGTVTETGKKIDKEPHDWDEGTITTAATCIAKGVITYKCKNCGAEKPEKGEAPIDKTNHVHTAVVGQKEATCTAEGYTGDTKCSDCGTVIEQGKAIAKKAHELDDGKVTKEATCSATGVRTYKCKNCDYTETEVIPIDKTNHVGPIVDAGNAKEASCTEEGYTGDKKCQACGTVTEQGKAIAKKAHELDDGTVTKEATCSATGVRTYKCKNCEYTETEEIPIDKTNHVGPIIDAGNAKEASCTEEGYTGDKKCQACGTVTEQGKAIAKKTHELDDGTVTKEATCSATGVRTCKCKNCEYTETEEIPIDKTNHVGPIIDAGNAKEASCTEEGYTGDKKCQACGTVTEQGKAIAKKAHELDDGTVTKEATCSATGVRTYKCKNCEYTETEEIPIDKTNHVGPIIDAGNAKEASCTEEGYTGDKKCQACGTVTEQGKAIAKKAHELDDGTVTKEATCSATGVRTYKCKNCEYTETEEIPMKEHVRETVPGKAATCTESGLTDGVKCSECGEILVAQEKIPALGHDFEEWKIIMKPTITTGGILRRTCKRPGCLFTEEMREDATGKVGNVYTVGDCTYTITDMENLTVSLTGWNGKGTAFAVPDTVTIGGAKFTVTGIGAGAFAGNGKYYLTIINPTQALTTDPTTLGLVISRIQKEENVVISQVAVNTSDNTDDSSNDGDQSDSTGNVSASENAIDRILKGMNSNSKQNVFELDYAKQSNLTCDDFVKLCKTRSDAEKNCLLTCDGKLYVLHIPANIDTESDDFKTCLETFRANPYNGVAGPLTIATIFKSFGIICTQLEEIAINDASEKSLEEAKFIASKVAQSQDDKRYDFINQNNDLINQKNNLMKQLENTQKSLNEAVKVSNDLINQKNNLTKQLENTQKSLNEAVKNNLTKQLENTQKSLNEAVKARDKYQEKYKNATTKSTKSEATSRAQVLSRNNAIGDGNGGYIAQGGHVQINGGKSNVTFTLAAPTSGVLSSANKYANSVGGSLLHCVTTSSPGVSFKTATVNFTVTGVYANETIAVYQLQGKNWVQVLVSSVTDNHVVVSLTQHGPLAFVRVAAVATDTH